MKAFPVEIENLVDNKKHKIIRTALLCENITRAEIADICGVSNVTVGKIVTKLIESDVLSCEKRSLGVGPHTDVLSPSDKINTVFLHLGKSRIKLSVCDMSHNIIFEHSLRVDESIPYESNLTALAMSVYNDLKGILANRICSVAVAFDDDSLLPATALLSSTFEDFTIDFSMHYNDYIKRFIGEKTDKSILLIRLDNTIDISLICGDRVFSSERQISDRLDMLDLSSAVFNIADTVAHLLKILIPDKIIIESDTLPINDTFINTLTSKIKECAPKYGDLIPEIYDGEALRLALRAASDMTLAKLADILCEK